MDRKLALVTGASAGIGTAFAKIYAGHGYDVALTARRGDRLERLAEEIRLKHGVETLTIAADLSDPEAPGLILDHLAAHGRAVDALVNNAGYGVTGGLLESSWETHEAFLRVMLTAPTELAYRVLSGMVERRFAVVQGQMGRRQAQMQSGIGAGQGGGIGENAVAFHILP